MITYQAPGKAVIWGEYAVLEGAPALVMAVDRYARAEVAPIGEAWHIRATGFESEATLDAAGLLRLTPENAQGAVAVIRAVLSALGDPPLPRGMEIRTDTSAFHVGGAKLGIGSSAAVCTAACAALASVLDQPFSEPVAKTAHRYLQGGAGSGLDVAAACAGGLLRFQKGESRAATWPEGLHYQFFWVGHSASTIDHLAAFNRWKASGETAALDALCGAAADLFDRPDIEQLSRYVRCLKAMDEAANLGIYGPAHARLDALASRAQVVYKPCGAGGGDIGIAVSDDASRLDVLMTLANQDSFLTLNLEIAAHGLHRISS